MLEYQKRTTMTTVINTWFPTAIYVSENIISDEYNNDLQKRSLEIFSSTKNGADNWKCNTYNTMGTYEISEDPLFKNLLHEVKQHLNFFVEQHGSDYKYECQNSWLNVNYKNTYQEYHYHSNSTFSAVYYIDTPENCGRIYFENPLEPDMLPVKGIKNNTPLSFKDCHYQPQKKTLLIFRSFLRHMVEIGSNDDPRISIAFNF